MVVSVSLKRLEQYEIVQFVAIVLENVICIYSFTHITFEDAPSVFALSQTIHWTFCLIFKSLFSKFIK
jgi:hypothetical protein